MIIKLETRLVARFLAIAGLSLFILNTVGYLAHFLLPGRALRLGSFSFGAEHNVPTYYASMLFLAAALLSLVVAVSGFQKKAKFRRHWAVLSVIFVYCSLDEMLVLHERLIKPLRRYFHATGVLYFTWIVPFALLLVLFAGAYMRFLISLPPCSRWLFLAAGAIYVLGAIGLEMLGGRWCSLHGSENLTYRMFQTVEESLELGGLSLCIYALASHIKTEIGPVTVEL